MTEQQPNDETPAHRYTAALANQIEQRWQRRWEDERVFEVANPSGVWGQPGVAQRPKRMVQDMFSYPSGAGLHVGHPLPYIATDSYARFLRTQGFNVLFTQGFDAFGLPAEQHAVNTGRHPRETTEENIGVFTRQLRQLGLSYDQRRRVSTIDPEYYRWTQWIFLQIFNSWYDERVGKARPIAELERAYAAGEVPTPDGRPWAQLTGAERVEAIDARRLAYKREVPVNWAPGLGTVVANEEVTNEGLTERGDMPVFRRNLSQWMMRITAYADRLTDDLDRVEWPESIKTMQRNWIGRSHGAAVTFPFGAERSAGDEAATGPQAATGVEVFTTRPDTIFGATFLVLAPEHPLLSVSALPQQWPADIPAVWTGGAATPAEAVADYQLAASRKSDLDRQAEEKTKTGVFTGLFAQHPVTGQPVPIFTADYVLMGYGTGAIMAVPGQDERDWAFATQYELPILRTVAPPDGHPQDRAYTGAGPAINSSHATIGLDGLEIEEAKSAIIAHLEAAGLGRGTVTYKLRDWLFSRQRYWGEPFPIVYDEDGHAHAVPEDQLPVELPEVADYSPRTYDPQDADSEPVSPLSRATDWVEVDLDLGDGPRRYRRETDTMPNWAGSCWYELRYTDAANAERFVDPQVEEYWMGPGRGEGEGRAEDTGGVDLYVGGAEHAVLHLLYSRFWHKVLHDLGHVSSQEPFRRLFIHGYVQAFAFRDHRGQPVPADEVVQEGDGDDARYTWQGSPVTREYGKMGKSLKNVVTPDEMCREFGADTFRVYEMSTGPLDQSRPWETRAMVGAQRFLQRLWRNAIDEDSGAVTVTEEPMDPATEKLLHRTIDAVSGDYQNLRLNTAIAKMIEYNNAITKMDRVPRAAVEPLVQMVAPVAPHLAEELWERLGHDTSVAFVDFPQADPALLVQDEVTCVIQVKGKVRDRIQVPPGIGEDELRERALSTERIREIIGDGDLRTVIVRAPKLVNIVPV